MTTTAESLADLIVGLLKSAGVADGRVYGVRAWPTQDDQLPQVQFALPEEDKQAIGRSGAPQFTALFTLPILITSQALGAADEAGAAAARAELADIGRSIERAVVGQPDLMRLIQKVAFIKTHGQVDATGKEVVGRRVMMIGLETYQGPEDFYDEDYPDLDTIDVAHAPTGDA